MPLKASQTSVRRPWSMHVKPLEEEVLRSYIGGAGLGTWLMHECCPPGVDPLAPAAPLIFVFSPLVGTPLTTSAKFAGVAKSPLTGRLTDAPASSHFARSLSWKTIPS